MIHPGWQSYYICLFRDNKLGENKNNKTQNTVGIIDFIKQI